MKLDTDVLIIGAGPAGLSAAYTLTELGIEYTLLSKEESPGEHKACGGFVPQRTIDEMGLQSFEGSWDVKGIRMKFPEAEAVCIDFDSPVGINTSRKDLGLAMLKRISRHQDNIRLNAHVRTIDIEDEKCTVKYEFEDKIHGITAQVIIDASGSNPVSLKKLRFRERINNDQMGYAVQYHYRIQENNGPFDGINDFVYGSEYSPGGYAWYFPRGYEVVIGTGGIVSRVRKDDMKIVDYLDHFAKTYDPIAALLEKAELFKKDAAPLPLAGVLTPSYSDRIMLAGDAAGHCSPISGEGIHYSIEAGKAAAQTAKEAIRNNDCSSKFLRNYERRWKKEIGSDLKWGHWLQKKLTRAGGSKSFSSSLTKSEKTLRTFAEMLVGIRSVRSAILSVAPAYIRSKIKS